jgi:hypothetical protein
MNLSTHVQSRDLVVHLSHLLQWSTTPVLLDTDDLIHLLGGHMVQVFRAFPWCLAPSGPHRGFCVSAIPAILRVFWS